MQLAMLNWHRRVHPTALRLVDSFQLSGFREMRDVAMVRVKACGM